jgi:sugar O-acyltransferase (sialic acid O-acetyltransferase NeuD family)
MKPLLIIGASGHGRVVADTALTTGAWDAVRFVDDNTAITEVLGFAVVGTGADLEKLARSYSAVAVAIGNPEVRLRFLDRCAAIGFELPKLVHPSAVVSRFASIGAGTVVFAQSAINAGASVGRGCIINTGATVDHDCVLEDGVHVSPGAHVAGEVHVGARSWIGIGASVKQCLHLGSDVIVGAGAAVISNIESKATVVGVPARAIRKTHAEVSK